MRASERRLTLEEGAAHGECPREDVLARLLAGRLHRRVRDAVLAHAAGCRACRELLFAGRVAERMGGRLSDEEAEAALDSIRGMLARGTPCPQCGEPAPAGASFCHLCGSPLPGGGMRCVLCGAPVPPGARFCSGCGGRLGGGLRGGGASLAAAFDRLRELGALNLWLWLALGSFLVSFAWHRRFWQFLILTLIFGLRWALAGLQYKTLVMIYEAWRRRDEVARR